MLLSNSLHQCFEAAQLAILSTQSDLLVGCRPTHVSECKWIQTPDIWGLSVNVEESIVRAKITQGTGVLLQEIERVLCLAKKTIDVASLEHFPDGVFLDLLERCMIYLDQRNRKVRVRMLFGAHLASKESQETLHGFIKQLTRNLRASSQLTIQVSRMLSHEEGLKSSWNHAKLITADEKEVITGGHNLWSDDYLGITPVHDLSAVLQGDCAREATVFMDHVWSWIGSQNKTQKSHICHSYEFIGGCLKEGLSKNNISDSVVHRSGHEATCNALSLLRLGRGLGHDCDLADGQALAAVMAAFRQTRSSLLISHMDLGFRYEDFTTWPEMLFACWADLLSTKDRSITIKIVLSQPNDRMYYSWNIEPGEIIEKMRQHLGERKVTGDFSVATIQYSETGRHWLQRDSKKTVANHSKTWIVDEHLFYIGSDNLYPHSLQEFGYLIDSRKCASELIEGYWNPLWHYSKQNKLSLQTLKTD
jgi:phosphatidylserine/phosphatidylglycerophosphate/cardiolipin synthase-like enzyme